MTSSNGESIKAPPNAMPPNADFFRKSRRGFSEPFSLFELVDDSVVSGSFNPNLDKIFCDGVMIFCSWL
jgi:hypothetical protein